MLDWLFLYGAWFWDLIRVFVQDPIFYVLLVCAFFKFVLMIPFSALKIRRYEK